MSFRCLLIVTFLSIGFAGVAHEADAGPLTIGSQIKLFDGPGNNGGGEFYADVSPFGSPYEFITFCLQRNEFFTPGQAMYVGGITDHTLSGNDLISPQTAYLYTNFADQTLANYAFTGTISYGSQTYDRTGTATALQMAFWYLEGEVTRDGSGIFRDAYNSASFGTSALADYYVALANASGWNDIGNVRVLNMYASYSSLAGFTGHNQDQLYIETPAFPPVVTPEPGTLVLFGLGISAMALTLRRRADKVAACDSQAASDLSSRRSSS